MPGADVTTNLVKGTITLRSETAQTYFLEYQAAYGTADTDIGKIRVDVRAPENPPVKPVAVPDTVTLFGQAGSLVDVLANDVDPSGGLLSVQRAEPLSANQLDVAVVDGRWLQVSARQGQLSPNPQIIRYTITNGRQSGIAGQVVVSQRPPPADDTPVTQNDEVTVREGSSQAISVLDNDFSPSGGTLTLVSGSGGTEAGAGLLDVQPVDSHNGDAGAAFVSGRTVRYVAPSAVPGPQRFVIRYQAVNEQGDTATGKVRVTVRPIRLKSNNPPEPPVIEGRTVSGDTVKLRLPGYGVDPDGDPVTILGLDSAPELGQVVRIGANSIEYTAYPNSEGTDEFTYRITDSLGARSTGSVRVSIAPPGPPQPPLAVADSITVAPGRTGVVDVLANDLVAAGSRVSVSLVAPPPGVRLRSDTGPIELDAPDRVDGRSIEVVYRITDGLDSSQTTVTLRTEAGYNNPPVVSDAFGAVGDGRSVTADVLTAGSDDVSGSTSGAYDPDGPFEDLVVADVYAPPGIGTRIEGGRVTVERAEQPMVVPFRVEDGDGGATTGSLYVPAADSGLPFVDPDAMITLKPGQKRDVDLSDYVTNPSGGPLAFTLKSRIWASPLAKLEATVTGDGRFRVSAVATYSGPGAVVFEVTTGSSVDDPDGVKAILSVPVQVGETRPILRCPEDPIDVAQAESVRIDIGALCHVWTAAPAQVAQLSWSADFDDDSDPGLTAVTSADGVVEVRASSATQPGRTGSLLVAADNSRPGLVRIRVVRTPPPSLAPIRVSTLKAGESQTIDLAPYLTPEVSAPVPTVVNAGQLSDLPVQIDSSGSSVTIRAGAKAHGRAVFRVVMSDVADSAGAERRVEGRITLDILGVPDVPGVPVPGKRSLKAKVELDWRAPQSNGAPIDYYEVRDQFGHVDRCRTSSCTITGLTNGEVYRFSVRAHNAVGFSGWSRQSIGAKPDDPIDLFGRIRLVDAGDQTLKIAWVPVETKGGAQVTYVVRWAGGQLPVTAPRATITNLDNHLQYVFEVVPRNVFTFGTGLRSEPFQPVGKPFTPPPPTLTDQETAGAAGAVTLTWPEVDANGPGPLRYTVYRDNQPIASCTNLHVRVCDNANLSYNGHVYDFAVRATNGGGEVSDLGQATPVARRRQARVVGLVERAGDRQEQPGARGLCRPGLPGGGLDRAGLRRRHQGPPGHRHRKHGRRVRGARQPRPPRGHARGLQREGRVHPVVGPEGADLRPALGRSHPQHHADRQRAHRLVDHRGRQQRQRGDAVGDQRPGPFPGVRSADRRLHVHDQRDGVRLPGERDGDRHAVRSQPEPRAGVGDQLGHHRAAATAVRGGLEGRRLQRRPGRGPAAVRHRPVRWAQVHGRVVRVRPHHLEQLARRRRCVLLGQRCAGTPLQPERQHRHS